MDAAVDGVDRQDLISSTFHQTLWHRGGSHCLYISLSLFLCCNHFLTFFSLSPSLSHLFLFFSPFLSLSIFIPLLRKVSLTR